jgi:hypothetical protein
LILSEYIIVKNAMDKAWELWYDKDPKQHGIHPSHSAFNTFAGKLYGIQPKYRCIRQAHLDAKLLNEENPSGQYAVCPISTEEERCRRLIM